MFESCRAHFAVPEPEDGVSGNFGPHVPEADHIVTVARSTGHAPDGLPLVGQLGVVLGQRLTLEHEHAERAVDPPAVMLPCDRLLAGVTALLEVDRASVQTRLGRQDALVELESVARRPGANAEPLELVVRDLAPGRRIVVE
jgi:hypothetical protein